MRKLITLGVVSVVLCSLPLLAVTPRFWQVTSADEFLAGEVDGVIVTARGELLPGPSVRKLASFTDPFVLSQARDAAGNRFFGTGNSGRVYRLQGTETKVLYTAPEPEIYAVATANGALYAGSSPNGKVYRIDPSTGAATTFFDPKEAFIWSIVPLPNGDLVVATGVEGKIYRVDRNGAGKVLYDAPETHIRSLALANGNRLIAGGSGEGRIYEVRVDGGGRALFDSPLTEISSIYWDAATNTGWAAAVANYLPATAPPAKQEAQKQQTTASTTTTTTTDAGKDAAAAAETVSVSFSFDEGTSAAAPPGAGSELYKISGDGFVDTVRRFEREVVYALTGGSGSSVILGTGPAGRVYRLSGGDLSVIATVPEKQVVTIEERNGQFEITTTNAGAVYDIAAQSAGKGELRSAIKDTERFSSFGHYEVRGDRLDGKNVKMFFRSGNTNTPDTTWSDWVASGGAEGEVGAPAARYVQWKLVFDGAPSGTRVDNVQMAYVNRNSAPMIDSVTVLEPAAVVVSSSYPANPQVLEATNPDEYGIFTSLDAPRDRNDPGKKMFRRGYRTVTWKAHDDNNDTLRYDLFFRRKGAGEWLRLRENMEETQINFDTSQLPDGFYELRLVATDAPDNPVTPLTDAREGTEFMVDNGAPAITSTRSASGVTVQVSDRLSPVGKVEYSIDAKKWIRLVPVDGIADSRQETYQIPAAEAGRSFVVLRAVDSFYNVATANVGE